MSWLSMYCCVSRDIEMYSFWDVILLNIINLPQLLDIEDYDTSLFSDASQILSPKRQVLMQFDGDIEEDELKLNNNNNYNNNNIEPDKDESRIDLYLAYIMNEYDKINEEGTNIYKLNVLHNQITMIFEEFSSIIIYGLRCNDVIHEYLLEKKSIQSKESKEKEIDKEDITQIEKQKFIFLCETLKPWLRCVFCIFHDQLKSGHLLVKTLEFIGSNMEITTQLKLLLEFCDIDLNINIEQRLKCLQKLQSEIISIKYTDDLKQRIKQNIVQWHYLTLLQVDQLITTLLNDTKAPTDLKVSYRCGNYIQLDWKPPSGAQFEYVKYEISQQLAHKTQLIQEENENENEEGNEYLDPSTHLLGIFNVNKPPICITINLTNLVIIPTTNKEVNKESKPVVATNCLLRIRGITNKIRKEIKSAWSDSVNISIFNTELIEQDMEKFIENMNNKNIDFYALQAMVDDGFNYEENEIKAMSSMIDNEVNALEILIKNAQDNLLILKKDKISLENKNKKLPFYKNKCNELFMKLNNIYTSSVKELEDKIEKWTVPDCLCWFDRVGLCRFSKYHSILKENLNTNHVKNFLKFTAKDLNNLGIDCANDNDKNNDCDRILHYISKCKKKQKEKLQKRKITQELERKKKLSQKIRIEPHAIRALSDPTKSETLKFPFPISPPRSPPHNKYYKNNKNNFNKNNRTVQPKQQQQNNVAQPRTNYHNPLSVHHPTQNLNANNYNNYNYNQSRYNNNNKAMAPQNRNNYDNFNYNKNKNKQKQQPTHPQPQLQPRINNPNKQFVNNYNNNNRLVKQGNRYNKMWQQQQIYQQQRPNNYSNYTNYNKNNNNNNNYNNYNNNQNKNYNNNINNKMQIPSDFLCPISKKMMREPVMAADGRIYDKSSMEKWLKTSNISPVFRTPLRHKMLMPYNELAGRINIWKTQHSMK